MAKRTKQAEAIEQARRALSVFRSLQPTLNAYARMLTGNPKVRVAAHEASNGSTDGKTIFYRPPISLGKKVPHQRLICDRRDELEQLLCPACADRELMLRTIYHEIAHIWFKTFDPLTPEAKEQTIREAVNEVNSEYGKKVANILARVDGEKIGYMGLARMVSPYLPMLLNALEDARVNRELHVALPGTRVMFSSTTLRLMRDGVEQLNDSGVWEHRLWSTYPLNAQVMAGILCMAQGLDYEPWLDPFVVEALKDDALRALVNQTSEVGSIDTAFSLSFPILARLRELGFCRSGEDPEDNWTPPYQEEADDSEEIPGGSSESSSESEEGGGSEGTAQNSDASDGGSDSAGNDDSEAGSDSSESDGQVSDDNAGGSESESGSAGPSNTGGDAGGDAGDDTSGAGDPGEPGSDSVPEEAHSADGSEVSESDGDESSENSGDPGNGDGTDSGELDGNESSPGGGVDRLPSGDPGNESQRESGDSDGDPGNDDGHGEDAEVDPVDTGAATEGIRTEDKPKKPPTDWGSPEEVEKIVMGLGDHKVVHHDHDEAPNPDDPSVDAEDSSETEHAHLHRSAEDEAGDEIVKRVLMHGTYFETPASGIEQIRYIREGEGDYYARPEGEMSQADEHAFGIRGDFDPPEATIGPAVSRGRIVFSNEARTRHEIGLKRGRVHGASLARRAPFNDPKMFSRKQVPDSPDHFVGIGIDISGSTIGHNLVLAKKVAFAEAEVLSRLGIPFFMMAHSGDYHWDRDSSDLTIREIKSPNEPWSDRTRERLRGLSSSVVNLDGHTIEVYRGMLAARREKVKILHYYTDGKMPAENYEEELEILQREIQTYRRQRITLVGVGIRTDSPREHGLECVEVHEQSDVLKVVADLETRLTKR